MGHDRRYCLDVHKMMALGWEPDYTNEEAIRATVRWYVDNDVVVAADSLRRVPRILRTRLRQPQGSLVQTGVNASRFRVVA